MASGAFESIVIGGRRFTCKADDSPEILYPGFTNESMVQGDGSVRYKKTRITGHINGISVDIDDTRNDQEFLKKLQDGVANVPVTATMVDGTVITGECQIIDELARKGDENTIELNLEGNFEKM